MSLSTADIVAWVASFMWPFVRFGAMMSIAPFFSARSIPVRMRVMLAAFLAYLVAPGVQIPSVDLLSANAVVLLVQEVLVGLLLGFLLQVVFAAVVMAGQTVATSMGLGFAAAVDPQNGVQVTVVGQFYLILSTLLFLVVDGHLVMIQLLAGSFSAIPVGQAGLNAAAIAAAVMWSGQLFTSALLIALPVVIGVILTNMALGIVTRAAPQLNIFAVGFPITMLAGFTLLLASIPALEPLLLALFEDGFTVMRELVGS